jgi:hypothetical protein
MQDATTAVTTKYAFHEKGMIKRRFDEGEEEMVFSLECL